MNDNSPAKQSFSCREILRSLLRRASLTDVSHSGFLLEAKDFLQFAYERGMHVLTSAQSTQETYESGQLGHGYLTYALLEGLQKDAADLAPKDGKVTLREWLEYAIRRVPELISKERGSVLQIPVVFYRPESETKPFVMVNIAGPSGKQ